MPALMALGARIELRSSAGCAATWRSSSSTSGIRRKICSLGEARCGRRRSASGERPGFWEA